MTRPDPELMACADCLCLASRKAARAITSAFDRSLRAHGIRVTQFTTLVMLMLRGPLPVGELARSLGTERTTLTRNLELLEDQRWIESHPGEDDSRSRILSVTPKGEAAVRAAFPEWRKAQEAVAAAVGQDGAAALRKLAGIPIR
jgi:DNA-binding MarR family transcriptional regulator